MFAEQELQPRLEFPCTQNVFVCYPGKYRLSCKDGNKLLSVTMVISFHFGRHHRWGSDGNPQHSLVFFLVCYLILRIELDNDLFQSNGPLLTTS